MTAGPVLLMLSMALLLGAAVHTYESMLAKVRAERDDLLDILDGTVDDMRRLAQERHPSSQQYGGGNLRIVR